MLNAGRDFDDVAQPDWNVGLAKVILSPGQNRAVVLQPESMSGPGSDGNDIGESRRWIGTAVAPGFDAPAAGECLVRAPNDSQGIARRDAKVIDRARRQTADLRAEQAIG